MKVDIWNAVVSCRDIGEEREAPCEPRAEDDVVDVGDGCAVLEEDCSVAVFTGDVRDRGVSLDFRVLERFIPEVRVVFAPDHGMDGCLGDVEQGDCCVGGGD